MKNFRDIELLSAYLDGHLNSSDSARLESRLSSDPELASVLNDLRVARETLRKLPTRRVPRNFTLTHKMVGSKPPLPRSFYAFRFSTAFATFLLLCTFAVNALLPRAGLGAAAPMYENAPSVQMPAGGFGGGSAATEAPAATQAPATQAAAAALAPNPTQMPPSADNTSKLNGTSTPEATTMPKEGVTESAPLTQPQVRNEAVVPSLWEVILFFIILISALVTFVMGQAAKRKWK